MPLSKLRALAALCAVFALAFAGGALAAPTVDGTVVNNSAHSNTVAVSITTPSANDAIILVAGLQGDTSHSYVNSSISSITSTCGLTFARLTGAGPTVGTDGVFVDLEIWSAPASSALTGCTLTANATGIGGDGFTVLAYGLHGLADITAPVDTNAGAKACPIGANAPPAAPTLTTSQANDLLMGFGWIATDGTNFTTSTWTLDASVQYRAGTAFFNETLGASHFGVSATQAATPIDLTLATTGFPFLKCALAFTADGAAAPSTSKPNLLLMGVS